MLYVRSLLALFVSMNTLNADIYCFIAVLANASYQIQVCLFESEKAPVPNLCELFSVPCHLHYSGRSVLRC